MTVTVAICTWNRAALLDQTLTRMRSLRVPAGLTWELLVVNNNSTDDTDAVIARHADALPVRRLLEMKQGHSHARNCAVEHARGELLVWTDDDVLVEPDWLAEYTNAAAAFPQADFFGGRVVPWFSVKPPRWIEANLDLLRDVYALRDYGTGVRPMTADECPVGASMAFRTSVLRANPFNPEYGRKQHSLTGGDDSELVARIRSKGHTGVWVGTAVLQHYIPAERLTRRYLWRWRHGCGRILAREHKATPGRRLFGVPGWVLRRYAGASLGRLPAALRGGRDWLTAYLAHAHAAGMVAECRA